MNETKTEEAKFEGYAILELMGHRRLGGFLRETSFAGAGVIRIDVPRLDAQCWAEGRAPTGDEGHITQFYAPSAMYGMTPVDGKTARVVAVHNMPEPVSRWEVQDAARALPKGKEQLEDATVIAEPIADDLDGPPRDDR